MYILSIELNIMAPAIVSSTYWPVNYFFYHRPHCELFRATVIFDIFLNGNLAIHPSHLKYDRVYRDVVSSWRHFVSLCLSEDGLPLISVVILFLTHLMWNSSAMFLHRVGISLLGNLFLFGVPFIFLNSHPQPPFLCNLRHHSSLITNFLAFSY